MGYMDYIKMGLEGNEPLKLILRGRVDKTKEDKVGVVEVVFATLDKKKAEEKINNLINNNDDSESYYMVYSVPFDTDLTKFAHYPSIEIGKEDLL